MRTIRTLVIDDHEMVARAIADALDLQPQFELVGTATSIEAGVALALSSAVDLVVTDLRLADGEIVHHVRRLRAGEHPPRILVMTGLATERSVLAALRAGVDGYVDKSRPLAELIESAHRVVAGDLVFPADHLHALLEASAGGGVVRRGPGLTPREVEVLQLLALGYGTTQVARELTVAVNTVRNHLASAMAKLDVPNRLAAVAEALRLGIVAPPALDARSCR